MVAVATLSELGRNYVSHLWATCGIPPGMGSIIKKAKGGTFIGWYIRYKDADGVRRQKASHQPTRELARKYLVEVEARVARGQIGIPEPAPAAPTVAELCARYLREYNRPRIKDIASYRRKASTSLNRVLPLLGGVRSDLLQQHDVVRARDMMQSAPASVRLSLAILASVYSWAVKNKIVTENPLVGVERPIAQPTVDYFSQDEVQALLGAPCDDRRLSTCIRLALYAGLRKGELLGLRWQDLDFQTRRLTIARSYRTTPKGNKTRHLRLPLACIEPLHTWRGTCPKSVENLVFPVTGYQGDLDSELLGLPALLQSAGLRVPARPWHALRHTFASHFIMAGGNILTLQKILGHSDIKVTLIYAHLAPDFLGTEMDRVQYCTHEQPGR